MTIANTEELVSGPYVGNGITAEWDYNFKIYVETELIVTRTNADATLDVLVLAADYTVAGVNDTGGGAITLVAPATSLPTGTTMVIEPDIAMSQNRPFSTQSSTTLEEIENSLDKLTSLARQVLGLTTRTLRVAAGVSVGALFVGAVNTTAMWDANGNLIEGPAAGTITSAESFAVAAAASAALAEVGFPFEDVAAFEAATIPATLMAWSITISGQRVDFSRDATSTSPITSANGVKGSPVGDGMPQHFGAVADGVTSDSPAFTLLIAWLATSDSQRVKLRGAYATDAPIVWNSFGLYVDTGGLSSTHIIADHTAGPAMQFRKSRCTMSRIQIISTATRLAGTYGALNSGIILGDFDWTNPTNGPTTSGTNTIITQCAIEEHNGCGVYSVSANNLIDGNSVLDNLGHGIWADSGQEVGIEATAQSGWGRITHNNCKRNGGHAVAVGDPTVSSSAVVYRMEVDNNDCADNATDAAICHGQQKQISLIGQGIQSAQNATKGPNGGMFVAGKDHKHTLNRFVGSTGECYEIGDYVGTFNTGGMDIDEMSVLTPAVSLNPAVVIASTITADDGVSVKQSRSANITNLVAIADRAKYALIAYAGAYDYGGGLAVLGEEVMVNGAEQLFTPTATFVTAGDASLTVGNRVGKARLLGNGFAWFYLDISGTFTHTTAAGVLQIGLFASLTGFGFDSGDRQAVTISRVDGVTISSGKFLTCTTLGTSNLRLVINKTGGTHTDVDIDDIVTGTSFGLIVSGLLQVG